MLEIVAKRDSLIALLEEERQRWCKSSCLAPINSTCTNACYIHIFNISSHKSEYLSFIFRLLIISFVYIFTIHIVEVFINCFQESLASLNL